jgi:hypothetical protein
MTGVGLSVAGCRLSAATAGVPAAYGSPGRPCRCAYSRIELSRTTTPFFLSAKDAKDAKEAGAPELRALSMAMITLTGVFALLCVLSVLCGQKLFYIINLKYVR